MGVYTPLCAWKWATARLARIAVAAVLAAHIAGCGGGGDDVQNASPPPSPAFVTLDTYEPSTVCNEAWLSGTAFISPTWWRCCSGSATDTGVTVTWSNAATQQSGSASQAVQYGVLLPLYNHTWQAVVPLALGDNPITITATDPAGLRATATAAVRKTASSYDISGTLTTAQGFAFGYGNADVSLNLSGDKTSTALPFQSQHQIAGTYRFSCVPDGSYTVTPTVAPGAQFGFAFTPSARDVVVAGADVPNQDFQTAAFAVSGSMTWTSGTAYTAGYVTITDGTHTYSAWTQPDGTYLVVLPNGSYTLTPHEYFTPAVFQPSSRDLVVNNADVAAQDFIRQP
jgi:hypothetical protein